jgi:hypothetical protein
LFPRPCGNQIGIKYWEAGCDENGIGGSGEYCGENDAHLGRINVLYHVMTVETCVGAVA